MSSRNFVFTLNNYTGADEEYLGALKFKYLVYGREIAPTTGTPHLQGFICFEQVKTFSAASKVLKGAHIEIAKSLESAIIYSKKDGNFLEKGVPPLSQKSKGKVEQDRWIQIKELAKAGNFDAIPFDIYMRYKTNLEKYHAESRIVEPRSELKNFWFVGPTGCGKSKLAREQYPGAYNKDPMTRWWDGYKGQSVVIIDDFDKYQVAQGGDMKRWADHYPFMAPVKGGYIEIRPQVVIVTSNYFPVDIWEDSKTLDPINRRFEIINMGPPMSQYASIFKP